VVAEPQVGGDRARADRVDPDAAPASLDKDLEKLARAALAGL
jgi:hypothetical protein